jgi:hypothetical protein
LDQGGLLSGFGQAHVRSDSTGSEDGLRQLERKLPCFRWTRKEAGELIALKSQEAREANLWKVRRLGDTNEGVGCHKILLGGPKVGASFQQ